MKLDDSKLMVAIPMSFYPRTVRLHERKASKDELARSSVGIGLLRFRRPSLLFDLQVSITARLVTDATELSSKPYRAQMSCSCSTNLD